MEKFQENIPQHIGIIMDGNGRWAKKRGKPRVFGHKAGMDAIERTAIYAQKLGVKVLTVYAFSTENWTRPLDEVKFIMSLPIDFYKRFVPVLNRENIQMTMIGDRAGVPAATLNAIDRASEETKQNTGLILNFAVNYGGRADILAAIKQLSADGVDMSQLTDEDFSQRLSTAILPAGLQDPDLIIRTSGELRLSNFLPWQSVYSELYFTDTLWPDFDEAELDKAVAAFAGRERRKGGIAVEQGSKNKTSEVK